MKIEYMVGKKDAEKSIKQVLKTKLLISTRLLTKLKKLQKIFINGDIAFVNNKTKVGDKIEVSFDYDEDDEPY